MTTNKPEVVGLEVSAHGSSPLIRLSDYEALQADYEKLQSEMATVKKVAYGNVELLGQLEALQAECEKLRREAETERAIQRAAEVLPLGFSIEIEIEKDAGTVALFGPGPSVSCDFHGSVAEQINDAIDSAIQEASHDN